MNFSLPPRPTDAIDAQQLKRVLVIMLRHHGDVLLTSPVYSALKNNAIQVEIDALIYSETKPMLAFNPQLSQVHTIDKGWKHQGVIRQTRNEWRLFKTLGARHYDLIIHLTNHWRGAWLTRALKPRWSVAPALRRANHFWKKSFSHLYPNAASAVFGSPLARRHMVEQHLDALRRLGLNVDVSPALSMVAGVQGEQQAQQFLNQHKLQPGYVMLQPTSRWAFKCWPVAHNAQLIQRLLARGETVVLSCAPDAQEQAMIAAIVAQVGPHGRLKLATQENTLNRLAALINHAKIFIGIDSAPMHIAAAMQTPTVALFGPSGEFNWHPWQVAQRVVTSQHSCRPCGQDGCGGGKVSLCLTQISVEQVLQAVDELLATPHDINLG